MNEKLLKDRKRITGEEPYSNKLTIELLEKLYEFIESDLVKDLEYFCAYDKGAILSAIEIIENQEEGLEAAKYLHRGIKQMRRTR